MAFGPIPIQTGGGAGIATSDSLPEGTGNLYYTEARVSANPSVTANAATAAAAQTTATAAQASATAASASAHNHGNTAVLGALTSAGSGEVITLAERGQLHAHANAAVLNALASAGSGQVITAVERTGLHTHGNSAVLAAITSAGDGQVPSALERANWNAAGGGITSVIMENLSTLMASGVHGPSQTFGGYGAYSLPTALRGAVCLLVQFKAVNAPADTVMFFTARVDSGSVSRDSCARASAVGDVYATMMVACPANYTTFNYTVTASPAANVGFELYCIGALKAS